MASARGMMATAEAVVIVCSTGEYLVGALMVFDGFIDFRCEYDD